MVLLLWVLYLFRDVFHCKLSYRPNSSPSSASSTEWTEQAALTHFLFINDSRGGLCYKSSGFLRSPRHYCKFYHSSPFILTGQINDDDDDDDEIASAARKRKSAISMFLYLVFLVCYLPQYFVGVTRWIQSPPSTALRVTGPFSKTLVFLNYSLNPIIYGWKMRHIRHTMIHPAKFISKTNPSKLVVTS